MTKPGHRPTATGPSPTHVCPGGCGHIVATKYYACKGCWWRLPFELRKAINAAYQRDEVAYAAAMLAASRWYAAHAGVRT